ncbi:MAG: helix-turn-helix transcriptional regulator [Lachnospiraceae bacterium]|nr:helix-turn-helix transcriptional regulator [Lachnospiraceae bacterium]
MIGYNNYSSFSRRFSAQVGMSPKQYQQNSQLSSL